MRFSLPLEFSGFLSADGDLADERLMRLVEPFFLLVDDEEPDLDAIGEALAANPLLGRVFRLFPTPQSEASLTPDGPALNCAARRGLSGLLAVLLPFSSPRDAADTVKPALHHALCHKHADIVEALAPLSDPRWTDSSGYTFLQGAVVVNHPAIFRRMLAFCDPRQRNNAGQDALMLAASLGRLDFALTLTRFCEPGATDETGRDAFSLAAARGGVDILKVLAPFSNPFQADREGQTPLMLAAHRSYVESALAVSFLLPRSDAHALDDQGRCAFDLVFYRKDRKHSLPLPINQFAETLDALSPVLTLAQMEQALAIGIELPQIKARRGAMLVAQELADAVALASPSPATIFDEDSPAQRGPVSGAIVSARRPPRTL